MTATRQRLKTVSVQTQIVNGSQTVEVTPPTTTKKTSRKKEKNVGYVTVEGGITKNLGDYNSARISVSVSLPCGPTIEGAKEAYISISELVDTLLNEEYEKAIGTTR
jgi:hypothetical protein